MFRCRRCGLRCRFCPLGLCLWRRFRLGGSWLSGGAYPRIAACRFPSCLVPYRHVRAPHFIIFCHLYVSASPRRILFSHSSLRGPEVPGFLGLPFRRGGGLLLAFLGRPPCVRRNPWVRHRLAFFVLLQLRRPRFSALLLGVALCSQSPCHVGKPRTMLRA